MSKEISQKYVHISDISHVLQKPDMYVGSMKVTNEKMYVVKTEEDEKKSSIILKQIDYVPALMKIIDEIIVNSRDHYIKMKQAALKGDLSALPVTYINVDINNDGSITVTNDGSTIDVEEHCDFPGKYIPELVFTCLRTSTNYGQDHKNIASINGLGSKLTFILSTFVRIELYDTGRSVTYTQTYRDNLTKIEKPIVKKTQKAGKPYTKITFLPDYARMGISGLSEDFISLIKRRVYDISALCGKGVKTKFNGTVIPVHTFIDYVEMYNMGDEKMIKIHEVAPNNNWEYIVCESPSGLFTSVSFVNGINVYKGGKHVEYISKQIVDGLSDILEQSKKKISIPASKIKSKLMLFLNCNIDFPTFDSQSKETLNTLVKDFGSTCVVSNTFIENVFKKMKIMELATKAATNIDEKNAKKTDGSKSRHVNDILKLCDANLAGSARSMECSLIVCEGDSAKTSVLSGLSQSDRDIYGIYALMGKIMNVRNNSVKMINENKEISELKRILGLEYGRKYTTFDDVKKYLRYGKLVIMTDQDYDGSHIKGLLINLFASQWPDLLQIPGFLGFFNTPIIKAIKGNTSLSFYNMGDYKQWAEQNNASIKNWNIQYYKGLGTSTPKEFVEYMKSKKIVRFIHGEVSDERLDMVFNSKRSNDRKEWLRQYNREKYLDTNKSQVTYEEFLDYDMIHFSKYDCDRSIPNIMDGLKISQRKILYACFKRNLNKKAKVAQLSGYISEHTEYHHGEISLQKAIIDMGQNFVGSNNIELLEPHGQFGSRIKGGQDAASPRYIFTKLNPLTRKLFPEQDDNILTYINEEGHNIEPVWYAPIIPTLLVNGSEGIGTGSSTFIPAYNPIDIIDYLLAKLTSQPLPSNLQPWYYGFTGTILKNNDQKYTTKGCYKTIDTDTIMITELPIGYWTQTLKDRVIELLQVPEPLIEKFTENHTDRIIQMVIRFKPGVLTQYESQSNADGYNGIEKLLSLYNNLNLTNMCAFDENEKLQKYASVYDIIDAFYGVRLGMYEVRKKYMIQEIEKDLELLKNKHSYIEKVLSGLIDLRKKKGADIVALLQSMELKDIDQDGYKYLIKMSMDMVSEEHVTKLNNELALKLHTLNKLRETNSKNIWIDELQDLKLAVQKFYIEKDTEKRDAENDVEGEEEEQQPKKKYKKMGKK